MIGTDAESRLFLWDKATERLYHEITFLNQRVYNFSTVQAFLTAALAFSSSETYGLGVRYLVALFGLALALFYIPLGLRGTHVVQFVHVYLDHLEAAGGVPRLHRSIDSISHAGEATVESGARIVLKGRWFARRPTYKLFPWYFGFSSGTFVGVGTPLLAAAFWLLVLSVLLRRLPIPSIERVAPWLILALLVIFGGHLATGHLVTGRPTLEVKNNASATQHDKQGLVPHKPGDV